MIQQRSNNRRIVICLVGLIMLMMWSSGSLAQRGQIGLKAQEFPPILIRSGEIELQVSYRHSSGARNPETPLTNGSIVRPGDAFRIVFTPDQEMHVYLYELTTNGQIQQLFPTDMTLDANFNYANPTQKGQTYDIRRQVNAQHSIKAIYLAASRTRHAQLEEQYHLMRVTQEQQNPHRAQLIRTELFRTIQRASVSNVLPVVHTNWIDSRSFHNPATPNEIVRVLQMPLGAAARNRLLTKGVPTDDDPSLSEEELKDLPTATLLNVFAERSADILPESYPLLAEYGRSLQTALRDGVFLIAAHSDNQGSERENEDLTRRRANAIRQFWQNEFQIADKQLLVKAYGAHVPMVSNETVEGRRLNNRIELIRLQ